MSSFVTWKISRGSWKVFDKHFSAKCATWGSSLWEPTEKQQDLTIRPLQGENCGMNGKLWQSHFCDCIPVMFQMAVHMHRKKSKGKHHESHAVAWSSPQMYWKCYYPTWNYPNHCWNTQKVLEIWKNISVGVWSIQFQTLRSLNAH